jgi:hypothetical protein
VSDEGEVRYAIRYRNKPGYRGLDIWLKYDPGLDLATCERELEQATKLATAAAAGELLAQCPTAPHELAASHEPGEVVRVRQVVRWLLEGLVTDFTHVKMSEPAFFRQITDG